MLRQYVCFWPAGVFDKQRRRLTAVHLLVLAIVCHVLVIVGAVGGARGFMVDGFDGANPTYQTAGFGDLEKKYHGYQVIRVAPIEDPSNRQWLLNRLGLEEGENANLSLWRSSGPTMDIEVSPGSMGIVDEALSGLNASYRVMIPDIQAKIDQQRKLSSRTRFKRQTQGALDDLPPADSEEWWKDYRTPEEVDEWLEEMAERYPKFLRVRNIGTTFERRPMKIAIVNPGRAQRRIWIDGGIHAREWVSVATANYVIYSLIKDYDRYKDIIDSFQWHILPVLNADGYSYTFTHDRMWRKTRSMTDSLFGCKGVDANRNWNFRWMLGATKDPCSGLYAGPGPESEPCVKAVSKYVSSLNKVGNVFAFFTLHSYGQLWMSPWGYSSAYPPSYDNLMRVAKAASSAAEKMYGTKFRTGTAAQVSGPASGSSDDWAYAVAGIPFVYTIELRDTGEHGFMLPPEQIVESGEEVFAGIMAAAAEILEIVEYEILNGDEKKRVSGEGSAADGTEARGPGRKIQQKPTRVRTPNRFQHIPGPISNESVSASQHEQRSPNPGEHEESRRISRMYINKHRNLLRKRIHQNRQRGPSPVDYNLHAGVTPALKPEPADKEKAPEPFPKADYTRQDLALLEDRESKMRQGVLPDRIEAPQKNETAIDNKDKEQIGRFMHRDTIVEQSSRRLQQQQQELLEQMENAKQTGKHEKAADEGTSE